MKSLYSSALFDCYWSMIKPFWKYFANKFAIYFEEQYLNLRDGWRNYEKNVMPSTNNSLESTNKILKTNLFDFKKLNIWELLKKLVSHIQEISYESENIKFPTEPTINPYICKLAVKLQQFSALTFLYSEEDKCYYIKDRQFKGSLLYKGKINETNQEIIDKLFASDEENICEYFDKPKLKSISALKNILQVSIKKKFLDLLTIRRIDLGKDLSSSNCNCPTWFFKRYCHHVLALLYDKNYLPIPILLKQAKKKGRPKKIKGSEARNQEFINSGEKLLKK